MFSIEEILDMAIRLEENGEKFYRNALEELSEPSLVAVLECLAEEESRHQLLFKEIKNKNKISGEDIWLRESGGRMLQNIIGDQIFSLREVDPRELKSEADILELAIEFEQDTILFYQMLRDFIADAATLKKLDELIAEEQRHKEALHKCLSCRQPFCQEMKEQQLRNKG